MHASTAELWTATMSISSRSLSSLKILNVAKDIMVPVEHDNLINARNRVMIRLQRVGDRRAQLDSILIINIHIDSATRCAYLNWRNMPSHGSSPPETARSRHLCRNSSITDNSSQHWQCRSACGEIAHSENGMRHLKRFWWCLDATQYYNEWAGLSLTIIISIHHAHSLDWDISAGLGIISPMINKTKNMAFHWPRSFTPITL